MTADQQTDLVSQFVDEAVAKKAAEAESARRRQFLVGLMNSYDGRRYLWDELTEDGLFAPGERATALAQWDTHRVAHALGVRHRAGLKWQTLQAECPSLLGLMVTEAMDRLRAEREAQ